MDYGQMAVKSVRECVCKTVFVAVSLELSRQVAQLETPTSAPKEALLRTTLKCLINYLFGYIQT